MEKNQYNGGNFIERLQYYMKNKGINDNQMTVSAGLSVGLIGKAKGSIRGMNAINIEKILLAYPDLNSDWLLTGRGDMLKTNRSLTEETHSTSNPVDNKDTKNNAITQVKTVEKAIPVTNVMDGHNGIPLIPFSAMAGALTGEQTVLEYECERYVVPAFKGADFLMPVKGNSMTPTYVSGDIVACQRVPMTDIFFQWNKPYVLDTTQGPLIKRIKPGTDAEHVRIISDNAEYDSFELPRSSIHAVALVIGIIRLE